MASKSDIPAFWGDLARQWYAENDARMTVPELHRQLDAVERFFVRRRQLAVVEMPLNLRGKAVLEIGSGGGGHAALFKRRGAIMTAVDITPERVASTALKLDMLPGESRAMLADAEELPFPDNHFDIVCSNGVLHHSRDTERCVAEAYRVLKPGGLAALMLYSRHSTMYWLNLVPKGLMTGILFRLPEAEWIGRLTEGKPKFGSTHNPYTRVYSAAQLRRLLKGFRDIKLRKGSFRLDYFAIPKAAKLRELLLRALGGRYTEAGVILYGQQMIEDCRLELALSPYIGWCWNVSASKPA